MTAAAALDPAPAPGLQSLFSRQPSPEPPSSEPAWPPRSPWSPEPPPQQPPDLGRLLRSVSAPEGRAVPPPPGFAPLPPRSPPGLPPALAASVSALSSSISALSSLGSPLAPSQVPPAPRASALPLLGRALSSPAPGAPPLSPPGPALSPRYKTELCRTFSETGRCRYGAKCQFAHGAGELRGLSRHPKYKTELCLKYLQFGSCPYGSRCHFIHGPEEREPGGAGPPREARGVATTVLPPLPAGAVCRGATLGEPVGCCCCWGAAAPPAGPRRLPIFDRISVSD